MTEPTGHLLRAAMRSGLLCTLVLGLGGIMAAAFAEVAQTPLSITQAVRPLVMFAMSNDHQLYKKAYDDYSDLNGDGEIETTYDNSYSYYGYFDPDKCYTYSAGDGYFSPAGRASDHQCDDKWSGNFLNWASMTRMDVLRKVLYGGYRSTDTTTQTILERVLLPTDVHAFAKVVTSADMAKYTPYTDASITLCNVTYASDGESQSINTETYPPLIRVASGSWPMWASGEVVECAWREEKDNNTAPQRDGVDKKGEFIARVAVCVDGLEETNCKRYPQADSVQKPTGLLQDYGEDGSLRFGLISGSYKKNKSGGVLRRNAGKIARNTDSGLDEINLDTGQFTGNAGIIRTINSFRLNKYSYNEHKYKDGCDNPGILSFDDGKCTNWGNPVSEIYLEALRYFAGKDSPTHDFSADDSSYFGALDPVTWADPMPADEWCAKCSVILLSTGVNSFDRDQLASDITGLNASTETNIVGAAEGINGSYLLGGATGKCDAKDITELSDAYGICPEGPSLLGGYDVAGLSYFAHTNDIRGDRQDTQTINTYAVALARDLPRFEIPVGGSVITLLPHGEANEKSDATQTTQLDTWRVSSLTDLTVESLQHDADGNLVAGSLRAYWEDSTWGNDYDMDGIERLQFCVGPTACNDQTVSADELQVTTSGVQAYAGHTLLFGFTVTGTSGGSNESRDGCDGDYHGDGVYREVVRPGGKNFSEFSGDHVEDNKPSDCVRKFRAGTSTADLLENPLWYAAKYGEFHDTNDNQRPDQDVEWDADTDGVPDNFFFADNPSELGPTLGRFLQAISTTSSSASVVANSITLSTGTYIYQARFDSGDWSGDLLSLPLQMDGSIGEPEWNARDRLNAQDPDSERHILTSSGASSAGVAFRWLGAAAGDNHLSDAQQDMLSTDPDTAAFNTTTGEARLNYLRGSKAQELQQNGVFRDRDYVLGDIVSSEPIYVGPPPYGYPIDLEAANYNTFSAANASRTHMLYVGANDGMLHGFKANTGDELIAYVPRGVFGNLAALTSLSYQNSHKFFVNGSPTAGDVYISADGSWRTVLVGSLGAGGMGMFALDITDPTDFNETNANSLVLWDVTAADTGYGDLGYTFSTPAIVRLPDNAGGKWAAVFGNGYGSANGKAVLYIVDIRTGTPLYTVEADAGPDNGLSSVAPVDLNGDYKIDYIYAGDLKGNLWRFEPSGGGWVVSFTQQPLFTAKDSADNVEPITSRPEAALHPSGGIMVFLGTGRYFETGDNAPNTNVTQSFYGIWDKLDGTSQINRSHLLKQEIVSETSTNGYDLRVTSEHSIMWHTDAGKPTGTPPTTHLGWYLDLLTPPDGTAEGEMQVTDSQLRGGRIVFTTMVPSDRACDYGGTGWLMELQASDGSRPDDALFDINGDGVFDILDMVDLPTGDDTAQKVAPSGKKSKAGIIQRPTIIAGGSKEYKYASGALNAQIDVTTENPGSAAGGRQSWIQLQ